MAKFKNCFNSTVGEGDEIKSFLYTSDGTALTQTGGALDVNIQSSDININVDLVHTGDSVALGDGTNLLTSTTVGADIGLDVNIINASLTVDDGGGSLTVDGTVAATQSGTWSVQLTDGTDTLAVNADGSVNAVVTATDFDIRDLTHVSDSVKVGDGTDFLAVNADGSINTKPAKDTTVVSAQPTVGTSAAVLVATATDQTTITVRNEGDEAIYVGPSGVTTGTGFKIGCGEVYTFTVNADLYAIAASATAAGDLSTLQIAA